MTNDNLKTWLGLVAGVALCYWQPIGGALLALGAFAFEYLAQKHSESVTSAYAKIWALDEKVANILKASAADTESHAKRIAALETEVAEVQSVLDGKRIQRQVGI